MERLSSIRQHFLDFFEKKGHRVVSSSSLVPNDPTLMFTAAGMVPFKNYFTGLETPPYTQAVSAQKCVRAGGKHNDLENVGYTSRHHTFFEMLGNFSFGDYFKEKAISYAWELVHKELGLPKDKLLVTVYHEDLEAINLWKKIANLKDSQIISIQTADNFWSMGDTGPCGPCSEIFYDHGPSIEGGPPGSANEDGDRFVEIWNLVFMQYDQGADERLLLPKPSIDTGSGLERLTAVLQGVSNNYDIDLFKNLIQSFEEVIKVKATRDALTSYRVIADHLRATSFLMADGVSPSNEGRGYVLRRIMRRAMRHMYLLGVKEPLMHSLVPYLVNEMQDAYPELSRAQHLIMDTLCSEETRFRETLGRGLKLLEDETKRLSSSVFPGNIAFKLYDTYGFPLDLTQDILRGKHKHVDVEGFNEAMKIQKEEARKSWMGSGSHQDENLWFAKRALHEPTVFIGYETLEAHTHVEFIVADDQDRLETGKTGWVITQTTPFYPESGGQVGDKGTIHGPHFEGQVLNTLKKADTFIAHYIKIDKGCLSPKDTITLKVDSDHRQEVQNHHSATHLLHKALKDTLGDHVVQKGSLVAADRLRFDFSCQRSLTLEEIQTVEEKVNHFIRLNTKATVRHMPVDEALAMGAVALFGEKYDDHVRVVSMDDKEHYSIELCGGTHVTRTGDMGFFKILHETGVAAGIRRIEAVTGRAAEKYIKTLSNLVQGATLHLKTTQTQLLERLEQLLNERKSLEKDIKALQKKHSEAQEASLETLGAYTFVHKLCHDLAPKDLKSMADKLRHQHDKALVLIGSHMNDKVSVVVALQNSQELNAIDLVKRVTFILKGEGGGGRPDMAQGGGVNVEKWPEAVKDLKDILLKIS